MTKDDQDSLEELIDRYGLYATMNTLSGICFEKAEHVRSTWQDHDLAMAWDSAGDVLDIAVSKVLDLNLDGR